VIVKNYAQIHYFIDILVDFKATRRCSDKREYSHADKVVGPESKRRYVVDA